MKIFVFCVITKILSKMYIPDNLIDIESGLAEVDSDKDPFVSSSLIQEPENKQLMTLTELTSASKKNEENEDLMSESSSNESSEVIKADENLKKSKSKDEEKKLKVKAKKEEEPKKELEKEIKKDSKKSVTPGVPFWTQVFVEKKLKDALVNVKTVTIIESITDSNTKGNQSVSTASSSDKIIDPYIKIQLPSTKSIKTPSTSSESKSYENKTQKHPQATILAKHSSSSIKKKPKEAISVSESIKSKTLTSAFPVNIPEHKTASNKISTSTKKGKEDAFSKESSTQASVKTQKPSTKDTGSLGSIFNVLKSMPFGVNENKSVYIEGKFKFPKEKDLNKAVYKMSGYISNA